MLLWFVIAYWVISVSIGLFVSTRVHNARDFAIAGRHLPFYMVTATVFATWFGSEGGAARWRRRLHFAKDGVKPAKTRGRPKALSRSSND